jgi:molybdate transport repressor ModE-like protein
MTHKPTTTKTDDRRYFKEVRFRQIRALVETAKRGSFAKAARTLGMTTPSVWRQVRALEDDYGVQFVAARGQEVRLTEDGERLVVLAAPLVEGFDSLKKVFADQHGKVARDLRVVAPAPVLNGALRNVIAEYRKSHPNVRLSLIDAPSRHGWQMLEAEKADLAIVGAPEGITLPARLEAVSLVRHPFEIISLADHPIAKIKVPKLRDILSHPLILAGEDSSSRMQFDHIVARAGLSDRANIIMTASNLVSILNYAALGLGVAVLTRPSDEPPPTPPGLNARLACRDASACLGHENIVLLHQRGRYELSHVRAFREMVVKELRRNGKA